MPDQVVFHGTKQETRDLLLALAHWCECTHDKAGTVVLCCPGHRSLRSDQAYVNHLEFARSLRDQLCQGEFSTCPTHRPTGGTP